jgi:hypothetical protein
LIFGFTMDAIRKTMIFLGLATVLLCVPLAAVAENDDVQIFPAVNSATSLVAASPRVPGTAREQVSATVVAAPRAARLSYVSEHASNFVLHDGRSHLRAFCLLRC